MNLRSSAIAIALSMFLLTASTLQAHQPVDDDGTHTTPEAAIVLEDFELSQVVYHEVTATSNQIWLTFDAQPGQLLYWQLGIPELSRLEAYRPTVVVLGPGLPALSDVPFDVPEGLGGLRYDTASAELDEFFEPFTATSSWILREEEFAIETAGTYYLVAYHPEGTPGKFWVAVGKREEFGLSDVLTYADTVAFVREFHEDSAAPYSLLNWGLLALSYLAQVVFGPILFLMSLFGF